MKENHTIERKGFMFVLSSPSGTGKTTLSRALITSDNNLVMSVSVTTRPKRKDEREGIDYHFISKEEFDKLVENDQLMENALVFDSYYGTPKEHVEKALQQGKDVLFDIDWQGTAQLSKKSRADLVSVFILPPSMVELERRLSKRGLDSEEVIKKRMDKASVEISHWDNYDYVLVNHDIADSLKKISAILHAERLKRTRQFGLSQFIDDLLR